MTFIRIAFLGCLALVLLVVALANRSIVTLQLLPTDLGAALGVQYATAVPLFVVIFLSVATGLLIGFCWEWLREHRFRAEASRERAQKERLERELAKTKKVMPEQDEVLALLDEPR